MLSHPLRQPAVSTTTAIEPSYAAVFTNDMAMTPSSNHGPIHTIPVRPFARRPELFNVSKNSLEYRRRLLSGPSKTSPSSISWTTSTAETGRRLSAFKPSPNSKLASERRNALRHRSHRCKYAPCTKAFTSLSALNKHERVHTGEKPFSCSFCGRGFSQRTNCVKHERIHTGSRPFSCTMCPLAFADSSTLKRHIRVHTGDRPYKCQHCTSAFSQNCDLRRHSRRLHPGKAEPPRGRADMRQ